jgi:methyl-accepting chemotaxis protein
VDRTRTALDAFNQALDKELALYATDRAGALSLSSGANRDLRKAYETNFDQAISKAKTQVADESAADDRRAATGRTTLLSLLVLMVAVGAVAAWLLGRAVTRPLTATLGVLEAAAHGDLTRRTPLLGAREFQRMAHATNGMLAATEETVATIAGSAETVNGTVVELASASREIAKATEGAARQAEQVSAAASEVSTSV